MLISGSLTVNHKSECPLKGQQVILLAVWDLYLWIKMSDTMASLSREATEAHGEWWQGGRQTGQRKVDGGKNKGWWENVSYAVICVGKNVRGKAREQERKKEREASWSQPLELCSPVVCTRWCSLIIHCMGWMSLSPSTALLHSALCLSAPGGRDGG